MFSLSASAYRLKLELIKSPTDYYATLPQFVNSALHLTTGLSGECEMFHKFPVVMGSL